jgi:NAD(P)-dependent dehydrogenase (short-subunit alcohol dehydrogenase family)
VRRSRSRIRASDVELIAAKGGTAAAFKADVTRETELKAMVADALARWGRIDILHKQ